MKRVWMILLALMLLLAAACGTGAQDEGKTPEEGQSEATKAPVSEPTQEPSCADALVGDWAIVSAVLNNTGYDPATIGLGLTVSFYGNGTGVILTSTNGTVEQNVFSYTASGNAITMVDQYEKTMTAQYDPAQEELQMQVSDTLSVLLRSAEEVALQAAADVLGGDDSWRTVTLEGSIDEEWNKMATITASVPKGCTLRIAFPAQADYTFLNEGEGTVTRRIHIPLEAFFAEWPVTPEQLDTAPQVTLITPEGAEYPVDCPTFSTVFDMLVITVTSEYDLLAGGVYAVKADPKGVYTLTGTVNETDVTLYLNDEGSGGYDGGEFSLDLKYREGASNVYTLAVQKEGCIGTWITITVTP